MRTNVKQLLKNKRPKQPSYSTPEGAFFDAQVKTRLKDDTMLSLMHDSKYKSYTDAFYRELVAKEDKPKWALLPPEEKKKYVEVAAKAKADYEKKLVAWEATDEGRLYTQRSNKPKRPPTAKEMFIKHYLTAKELTYSARNEAVAAWDAVSDDKRADWERKYKQAVQDYHEKQRAWEATEEGKTYLKVASPKQFLKKYYPPLHPRYPNDPVQLWAKEANLDTGDLWQGSRVAKGKREKVKELWKQFNALVTKADQKQYEKRVRDSKDAHETRKRQRESDPAFIEASRAVRAAKKRKHENALQAISAESESFADKHSDAKSDLDGDSDADEDNDVDNEMGIENERP